MLHPLLQSQKIIHRPGAGHALHPVSFCFIASVEQMEQYAPKGILGPGTLYSVVTWYTGE